MYSKKLWLIGTPILLVAVIEFYFSFSKRESREAAQRVSTSTHQLPEVHSSVESRFAANSGQSSLILAAPNPDKLLSAPSTFGQNGRVNVEDVPEGILRNELIRLDADAQSYALRKLGDLRIPLNDVTSLRVDGTGYLYYECAPVSKSVYLASKDVQAEDALPVTSPNGGNASVPIASPPIRHSKPGATKVIYLDFNGHTITGTAWNNSNGSLGDADYRPTVTSYVAKAFSTDGDATTFNDSEQAAIIRIWERVAEDYIPFDVDVTTEEPATFTANTGRILLTNSVDANGVSMPASATAAGVAFIDVFGSANYGAHSPALVYVDKEYYYTDYIAEAASHEMGHNLSLSHDGFLPNSTTNEYYSGHGSGSTSWGPIMGAPYNKSVTQWSKGEYYGANNPQDDLAIIAGHLGYARVAPADANSAAVALSGLNGSGIIGTTGEADRFSFTVAASAVSFVVTPFATAADKSGGDAGIQLQLYDAANTLVANGDGSNAYTPGAALTANLVSGTYYLRVAGSGTGDPFSSSPTGYTVYGSLGQYSIIGSSIAAVAPIFLSQPTNQTVFSGQSVSYSASAGGNPSPGYQWQRLALGASTWVNLADTGGYSGTATNSLSIGAPALAMNGDQFRCVATNVAGTATSSTASLMVNPAVIPAISGMPASVALNYGDYFSIYPTVSGTSPLTYQWKKDGVNIIGATSLGYFRGAWTPADSGLYTLVASNVAGAVTSTAAAITVSAAVAPIITGSAPNFTLDYGAPLTLSLSVVGTQPISLQWKKDGINIANANASYFVISGVKTADQGVYTLVATNVAGAVTSQAITVSVRAAVAPTITVQPVSITVGKAEEARFSVTAEGTPALIYQWYKNGQPIASATYSAFSINPAGAADSASYTVKVSNEGGSVISAVAELTVLPAVVPKISSWNGNYFISGDRSSLLLSSYVSGTMPMTFQWFKNGVAIANAHSSFYDNYAATAADAGTYTLQVSNEAGMAMSPDAIVTWTNTAATRPWLDSVQQGNVVYFVAASPGRIMRYDLTQETWLPLVYLPEIKVPTAFLPTAEGVYIAYGRELVRRSLDLQTEQAVATGTVAIQGLFSIGDLIYFEDGQMIRSINRTTLATGPDSSLDYYESFALARSRPAYSPSTHLLYFAPLGRLTGYSPDSGGVIAAAKGSPYFSEFSVGSRQYMSPNESLIFDNSGVILNTGDLTYAASLGLPYDDITFLADRTPIVLRGQTLVAQGGAGFSETGRYGLGDLGYAVYSRENTIFVFAAPISNATNPTAIKLDSKLFLPAAVTSPGSPSNKIFSIEDAFIDNRGVIHLLSRSEQGVVRWDTKTRFFLPTLPLRGRPSLASYAPAIDRLAFVYSDGALTDLFPTSDSTEQLFGYVSSQNTPLSLIALDELTFLNIGQATSSGDMRIVSGPLGELKYLSTWSYWDRAQSWRSASRRLYSTSQLGYHDGTEYTEVPATGLIPIGTSSAPGVLAPLQFSADGTLILSGGTRILNADLQQVGTLGNSVTDGVWLSDGLYTIRALPSGTELQKWARTTYSKTGSLALRGIPLRIFKVDDTSVVVVSLVQGYVAFQIVASNLSLTTAVVNTPSPLITTHVISQTATIGSSAVFQIVMSNSSSFTYQWQKNGLNIAGASGNILQLTNVSLSDAGTYTVIATNIDGSTISDRAVLTITPSSVVSSKVLGDFDGDGKADLVWTNSVTGERSMWFLNGNTMSGGALLGTVPVEWVVSVTGDFDGDGRSDVFLTNTVTGDRAIWLMNGSTRRINTFMGTVPVDWVISGTGDFNGDGKADLVWTNTTTGDRAMWLMNGNTVLGGGYLGTVPVAWTISGVGDFNGDGKADLIWSNTITGERSIWFQNGSTTISGATLNTVPVAWIISGVGDFNGDGKADVFLSNTVTGDRVIWLMNGSTIATNAFMGTVPVEWTISGTGDFNGDKKKDLFWTNTLTGDRAMWLLNGATVLGGGFMGTVPVVWRINN